MDFWVWWRDITDAQAQIISSLLTGLGILLGAWIGLGLVGDQVKKAKEAIAQEAERQIKAIRDDLEATTATANAGLEVAKRSELEQEAIESSDTTLEQSSGSGRSEDRQSAESTLGQSNYRDEASAIVAQAQKFVRGVADRETDGRYQRTYKSIPETYFDILAEALRERSRFTQDQADQAKNIANLWRGYQRGKASKKIVPREVRDELQQALARMIGT